MVPTAILLATLLTTQANPAALQGSREAFNIIADSAIRGAKVAASKEQQEDWRARRDLAFRKELIHRLEKELADAGEKLEWSRHGRFLPAGANPAKAKKTQSFPRLKKAGGREFYEFPNKLEMEQVIKYWGVTTERLQARLDKLRAMPDDPPTAKKKWTPKRKARAPSP